MQRVNYEVPVSSCSAKLCTNTVVSIPTTCASVDSTKNTRKLRWISVFEFLSISIFKGNITLATCQLFTTQQLYDQKNRLDQRERGKNLVPCICTTMIYFFQELRLAKWFAIFTLIFNVLWLPFVVTILLRDHCETCDTERSSLYLFILYFQLLSLTISAVIYYKASLDFRLAFKMVSFEFCNMIGRNANSDPSLDVAMHDGTIPRDSNDHVKSNARQSESSLRHSQSENSPSKAEHEEMHIVPFDQAKYFGEKDEKQDNFHAENEVNGGMSLDDEFGFHDIDIVPYDQSC